MNLIHFTYLDVTPLVGSGFGPAPAADASEKTTANAVSPITSLFTAAAPFERGTSETGSSGPGPRSSFPLRQSPKPSHGRTRVRHLDEGGAERAALDAERG